MSQRPEPVAPGIHRIADGLVNCYLVQDGDELLLVDTGWPSSFDRIAAAVTALGRSPADLRSIVLTHGHPDHLGAAEKVRTRWGTPVRARDTEVPRVRGTAKGSSPFALVPGLLPQLWRPSAFGFVLHAARHGFLTPTWVQQVEPFAGGDVLDLPGRPRALATPGHTSGHTSLLFEQAGALLAGDALVTLDVLTREQGPRLLPPALTDDPQAARASLSVLEPLRADVLLPGHGSPWQGTPARAVQLAREALAA